MATLDRIMLQTPGTARLAGSSRGGTPRAKRMRLNSGHARRAAAARTKGAHLAREFIRMAACVCVSRQGCHARSYVIAGV